MGAALAAHAVSAAPQSQDPQTLELQTVRFYRAANAQTLFDGFFRVPFAVLDAVQGPRGNAVYRVTVSVRDSSGLELWTQSWSQSAQASLLRVRGASALEHFQFATKPGLYTVQVSVTDSASGRVTRQAQPVRAFEQNPGASDLLLATGAREADSATAARSSEVRKGAIVLQAAPRPVLTPQQAQLNYYLELYLERAETVSVAARVRPQPGAGTTGAPLVATPEAPKAVPAAGGVTMGAIDLAGLPPGNYTFDVVVKRGSSSDSIVRAAAFRMAGFETEAAIAEAGQPADPFAAMTEAQLDTVYLPLVYLMSAEEQGTFPGLTLEGKRRWLRQFWVKRDPTPGTPRNEMQEDFYARMADANRRFREGGAVQMPGWRTDRGRIFIKYGAPDAVLSQPMSGNTRPYEVWKYTRTKVLKYVFLDQTLFGNYVLIYSNDRKELTRAGWRDLLNNEAIKEIERF